MEELFPQITFQFLPSHAPSWGGFYERMNRTIKDCLAKEFPRLIEHPYIEINSALAHITHRLNSRPLCTESTDRNDPRSLTPNDFLVVGPTGSFGPPGPDSIEALRFYHNAMQKHLDVLWHRMFESYLSALRVQHQWDQTSKPINIKVGDFVSVKHKHLLKSRWPIARVTQVVCDSTRGHPKAAYIETYFPDHVDVKKRAKLFGKKTKTTDLTPAQLKQVLGVFRRGDRPVLLKHLCPYELCENADVKLDANILNDNTPSGPVEFPRIQPVDPDSPEVTPFVNDASRIPDEKEEKRQKRQKNQQNKLLQPHSRKRKRDPVVRENTDRPRRKAAKYSRNYLDLLNPGDPD